MKPPPGMKPPAVRYLQALTAWTFILLIQITGLSEEAPEVPVDADHVEPGQMPYFDAISDPLEGFNRGAWAINTGLFRGIIYPLSLGYNVIAPEPVRTGISKAGHNLSYPVRLVNSCFQGKWRGAWEETKRFGVNSTVGLAGFFDPATKWRIGRSNEDFGQTLGYYGSGPGFYLMIPILGPSNGRDAIGKILDSPLDICFWIGQAYPNEIWPRAIRPSITFNNLSDNAPSYKRLLDSMVDPYQALRTLYTLNRERLIIDYRPIRDEGSDADPTASAILFRPLTPNFLDKAETRTVWLPSTGKRLDYSVWMQKKPAPMVYYIPGLGSYRLSRSVAAYADMLYRRGYSVVTFSNPFHQEFMERAATVPVPGYAPADCNDVITVLESIEADLQKWKGEKITGSYLSGVSHGGFLTLLIAAREAAGKLPGLSFDRYIAVNPPVSLGTSLENLDKMFNAPLAWPEEDRQDRIQNTFYKALHFAQNGLDVSGDIPLTLEESQFLIGLLFRYTLMNVIIDSQRRYDLGVLKTDPNKFVRQDSYREIQEISYTEFTKRFVLPYLQKTGRESDLASLLDATDLRPHTKWLSNNDKIRVQIAEDDFLLSSPDVDWFHSTFGDNLKAYNKGGHLGNLHLPAVQEELVDLFERDERAQLNGE